MWRVVDAITAVSVIGWPAVETAPEGVPPPRPPARTRGQGDAVGGCDGEGGAAVHGVVGVGKMTGATMSQCGWWLKAAVTIASAVAGGWRYAARLAGGRAAAASACAD